MSVLVILLYSLDICQVPSSLLVFVYSLHDPSGLIVTGKKLESQIIKLIEFIRLDLNLFIFLNLFTNTNQNVLTSWLNLYQTSMTTIIR